MLVLPGYVYHRTTFTWASMFIYRNSTPRYKECRISMEGNELIIDEYEGFHIGLSNYYGSVRAYRWEDKYFLSLEDYNDTDSVEINETIFRELMGLRVQTSKNGEF